MNRIIINNKTDDIDDWTALKIVNKVIANGLESETKKGKQYCFVSIFDINVFTGTQFGPARKVHVVCDKTKHGFSFQIYYEKEWRAVPWRRDWDENKNKK